MELIDEQYRQISKFVDGEMGSDEYVVFQASLNENEHVRTELELYREIDKLSLSIMQKLSTEDDLKTNTAKHKPALNWIRKARAYWEESQENALKRKHGFLTVYALNNTAVSGGTKPKSFWMKLATTRVLRNITTNKEKCTCKTI